MHRRKIPILHLAIVLLALTLRQLPAQPAADLVYEP